MTIFSRRECLLASSIAILLLLVPLPMPVAAQQTAAFEGSARTIAELQARLDSLFDQPQFAAARWGARIATAQNKTPYERDADKLFMAPRT